jgi:hypothetical protein
MTNPRRRHSLVLYPPHEVNLGANRDITRVGETSYPRFSRAINRWLFLSRRVPLFGSSQRPFSPYFEFPILRLAISGFYFSLFPL